MGERSTKIWSEVVTAAIFSLFVAAPLLCHLWRPESRVLEREKRIAARSPELGWSLEKLAEFPQAFDAYFNDYFPGRRLALEIYDWWKMEVCRNFNSAKVVQGYDEWLYLRESILRSEKLSDRKLARWGDALSLKRGYLAEKGIRYLFVLVPDKTDIYPQYLPRKYQKNDLSEKIFRFSQYLSERTHVSILDLLPVLSATKEKEILYYQTDTHWNFLGAFRGYQAIIERLRSWYPKLQPIAEENLKFNLAELPAGDLAEMVGAGSLMKEKSYGEPQASFSWCASEKEFRKSPWQKRRRDKENVLTLPFSRNCPSQSLRAVVFRDSFTTNLERFLSENFAHVHYVWATPDIGLLKKVVREEKPDIVIEEKSARFLGDYQTGNY